MNEMAYRPFEPERSPFVTACADLRRAGFEVTPADVPGLVIVNGPGMWNAELTMGQVQDLARQRGVSAF